jgi:hypothetical protein
MTNEEIIFINLVETHIGGFGLSVVGFDLHAGELYVLRVKRPEDPESNVERLQIFRDQMMDSVATGQLPDSLLRDFQALLKRSYRSPNTGESGFRAH